MKILSDELFTTKKTSPRAFILLMESRQQLEDLRQLEPRPLRQQGRQQRRPRVLLQQQQEAISRIMAMEQAEVLLPTDRDVNFFAFFAICAQIAIAIANFHNRSAIAIGFKKKIAVAAQSQSIISARNFSQIANCAQFSIYFHKCTFFALKM